MFLSFPMFVLEQFENIFEDSSLCDLAVKNISKIILKFYTLISGTSFFVCLFRTNFARFERALSFVNYSQRKLILIWDVISNNSWNFQKNNILDTDYSFRGVLNTRDNTIQNAQKVDWEWSVKVAWLASHVCLAKRMVLSSGWMVSLT